MSQLFILALVPALLIPNGTEEELRAIRTDEAVDEAPDPSNEEVPRLPPELEWLSRIELNAYGNFLGNRDDANITDAEGNKIDDRMRVRQAALELRSSVIEGLEVNFLFTYSSDPVADHEADMQEGYLLMSRLPGVDQLPLDMRLWVGKFRSSFGRGNRLRVYDLPEITRPLPISKLLGEDGFVSTGVAGDIALPLGDKHDLRLTLELLNSGDLPLTDATGDQPFASMGNADWTWHATDTVDVISGVSVYDGRKRPVQLFGVDLMLARSPEDPESAGRFHLGGEWIRGTTDFEGATEDEDPQGWYVWTQYEFVRRTYLGLRLDASQEPTDDSVETRRFGAYLGYVWNEYVRFNFGYERLESDIVTLDGANSVLVEVNFALGRSPRQPFWTR